MIAIEMKTKRCFLCEQTKPLSEFHRQTAKSDGHQGCCKSCAKVRTKASIDARRQRLGDEEFKRRQRELVREHRQRTGNINGKAYDRAQRLAAKVLRERHRTEYDHLLLLARRGELDDSQATA